MADQPQRTDWVCRRCKKPIGPFDGAKSQSDTPGWEHSGDCKEAAKKDYHKIAAIFQNVLYTETRRWWAEGIYDTDAMPQEARDKLDKWMLPLIGKLEDALKEAWKA